MIAFCGRRGAPRCVDGPAAPPHRRTAAPPHRRTAAPTRFLQLTPVLIEFRPSGVTATRDAYRFAINNERTLTLSLLPILFANNDDERAERDR